MTSGGKWSRLLNKNLQTHEKTGRHTLLGVAAG